MAFVTQAILHDFVTRLDDAFARPGRLLLVGETTQVLEGWRTWTDEVELCAEVDDGVALDKAVRDVAAALDVAVWQESPAEVIPLPDGVEERHRPAERASLTHLKLWHFDPYSVAFRFIARGDERDYHLVLAYLDHGWITMDAMDALLADLLPSFSMETIQQDPAEFRRRYKGLRQMTHAIRPGTLHRHTPA